MIYLRLRCFGYFFGRKNSGTHGSPLFALACECKIGNVLFGTVVGNTTRSPIPPYPSGRLLTFGTQPSSPSCPRKRASRVAKPVGTALDPRFRGGDEKRLRESSVWLAPPGHLRNSLLGDLLPKVNTLQKSLQPSPDCSRVDHAASSCPVPDGLLHVLELRTVLSAVVRKVARIECAE
jgi:hypothetical protein